MLLLLVLTVSLQSTCAQYFFWSECQLHYGGECRGWCNFGEVNLGLEYCDTDANYHGTCCVALPCWYLGGLCRDTCLPVYEVRYGLSTTCPSYRSTCCIKARDVTEVTSPTASRYTTSTPSIVINTLSEVWTKTHPTRTPVTTALSSTTSTSIATATTTTSPSTRVRSFTSTTSSSTSLSTISVTTKTTVPTRFSTTYYTIRSSPTDDTTEYTTPIPSTTASSIYYPSTTTATTATTTTTTRLPSTVTTFTTTTIIPVIEGSCGQRRYIGGEPLDSIYGACVFPWVVSLRMRFSQHYCAGVLVSSNTVVTAASCVQGVDVTQLVATLGEYDVDLKERSEVDVNISSMTVHPLYNGSVRGYNLALLSFLTPVSHPCISPVCVPPTNTTPGSLGGVGRCVTAGWGTSQEQNISSTMQARAVRVFGSGVCSELLSAITTTEVSLPGDVICSVQDERLDDECKTDGGNMLICPDLRTRYFLFGVVTEFTCSNYAFTLYTDITAESEWIKEHTVT